MRYYARRAYYFDLLSQRRPLERDTVRDLAFLDSVFKKNPRRVRRVLDVACGGGGHHIMSLAQKGYEVTGIDFAPERVEMARARANRNRLSLGLKIGDATKIRYDNEFDAVEALNILFLLPSDEDVEKCMAGAYRALKPGGVFVLNIYNAFGPDARKLTNGESLVRDRRGRGIQITETEKLIDYDPVVGVGWIQTTSIIHAPDGHHVFRDRERYRLFTYWDITRYLKNAGFKIINHYPDWNRNTAKRPVADQIVFVARKL
jgi:SAM-dependent methyltransferase